MTTTEIALPLADGTLTGLDFGGRGRGVLLVHGSGHNAAAWTDVAAHLTRDCHPVALDLRGHGQSRAASCEPEQYWRDIEAAVAGLSWERPVLAGHSTGGYAVTAAAAAGLVTPSAVCVVDGVVLDDRSASLAAHAAMRTAEAADQLRSAFRYGWEASEDEMRSYVEECVREAEGDWLNAGARPGLVEEVARRSFVRQGGTWIRRPTLEEIDAVTALRPEAEIFPCADVYDRLTCPLTVVLPDDGFYAARREEVRVITEAAPDRRLVDVACHHNVPMARPAELAAVIRDLL